MSKLKTLTILFGALLIGSVAAVAFKEYVIPTTGQISEASLSLTWLDGEPVTLIDWGPVDNNTQYVLEPINITNTSNIPVTLTLSYRNAVNITALSLTWNYTDTTLASEESVVVELYQTATASANTFGYDTVIRAQET